MSCMGCCGVMAVVLAAFDDSMKEVLALVNKTAYNITLACMSCVAYSLSWQLSTRGYCLIKHFAGAESARVRTHSLFGFVMEWQRAIRELRFGCNANMGAGQR